MTNSATGRNKFEEFQTCVIIPTYNNAATLAGVIADVAACTQQVIVVNDGSTDETERIARSFPFVKYIGYAKNTGKGWALRKGFSLALELGYRFAITIDSDGQHFAKDLPVFIDKMDPAGNALIIGARNMDQAAVPGKSSFGNTFSNFWFKVETGIDCPDTQSGYRLYPIALLKDVRFFTRKYEFEIEVLVRAAWKGIPVEWVPVTVYYPPKEERISHFRPFKDFSRISVLNTVLVLIALFYIKPRNFFRSVFGRQKFKQWIGDHLLNGHQSDQLKALSIGFGVFMGIIPIWGFQLVSAIFLAILLRLNKALVIVAANISIPPMIPLIIFCSYKLGTYWMNGNAQHLAFSSDISIKSIRHNFEQYIYGSITLAILAGALTGIITFGLLKLFKKRKTVHLRRIS
jgi:glycosyltransferase involved in cell wall biosynthesis